MPVTAGTLDPRSIITPDAFDVSDDLLGRPLAQPRQRLAAIVIDLVVIGLITLATKSSGMFLGIVAAIFFVRAGFKRTPVEGSVFNRAMRLSVGCLGVFIALVTAATWGIVRTSRDGGDGGDAGPSIAVSEMIPGGGQVAGAISLVSGGRDLLTADNPDEARTAMRRLVRSLRGSDVTDDDIRASILGMIPEDKSWSGDAPALLDEILGAAAAAAAPPSAAPPPDVAGLSTDQALDAYAALLRSGADDSVDLGRLSALRAHILDSLAADTLRAMGDEVATAQQLAESRGRENKRLTEALEKERKGGFFAWIGDAVNELGFGFGWASIYLTIMLSWWKGQTVGKRIMKIRVLRLDGEPVTWWTAFERAGGYAAGFATGLLGFAQIYWDANRQAIHDRIVGTVVIVDGAPKVVDWKDAL